MTRPREEGRAELQGRGASAGLSSPTRRTSARGPGGALGASGGVERTTLGWGVPEH